jgi:ATP-dependent Zn protease
VTARPEVIGAGYRRAGRFDNTVAIEMPGPEARLSMLQRLAKGKAVAVSVCWVSGLIFD